MSHTPIVTSEEAINHLLQGGVGVLPTDTVYGIVACAGNKAAVERLYALKHRERKPGTVIAANVEQLQKLGIPQRQLDAVAHLWPNPLSIVMPLGVDFDYLHQGVGDQPFRVVADDAVRSLLEKTGPLVTSSANMPGEPVATTIKEAQDYFKDSIDFYVDGGNLTNHAPSTIIRVDGEDIEVLRKGACRIW